MLTLGWSSCCILQWSRQPQPSSKLEQAIFSKQVVIMLKQTKPSIYFWGREIAPELHQHYCNANLGHPSLPKSFQRANWSINCTVLSVDSFQLLKNILLKNRTFQLGHCPLPKPSFLGDLDTRVCQDRFQNSQLLNGFKNCTKQRSSHSSVFLIFSLSGLSPFLLFPSFSPCPTFFPNFFLLFLLL